MESPVGTVRLVWRGGEHDFCLSQIGNILTLEANCNAGLGAIYARIAAGQWYVNDLREVIRLGLIGGGQPPDRAGELVKACVDANPDGLGPSILLAQTILRAVLVGVPDDPVGKAPAPEAQTGRTSSTPTAASGAQPSMESGLH